MRTKPALCAASLLAMLSVACGGGERLVNEGGDGRDTTGQSTVDMELIAFRPEKLTVAAGATVTWKQGDAGFHTVTSGTVAQGSSGVSEMPDGRFDSGQLATDKTFTFTFDDPGTYPYFCAVHPATMRAEVTVR